MNLTLAARAGGILSWSERLVAAGDGETQIRGVEPASTGIHELSN